MSNEPNRRLGVLLFPNFELLDVCGPLEMFGNLPDRLSISLIAATAGPVASTQGPALLADASMADAPPLDLLMVPGGFGTREGVDDTGLIDWLRERSATAELVMTVCTGTALLARTGALDGQRATTNKLAFPWVVTQGPAVDWVREARWVESGKFATSSGVSAGIDMALAVIARLWGSEVAEAIATGTEYEWHRDPSWDPFARQHGLV